MIWLLIAFCFFGISWALPFTDPYEEHMLIQFTIAVSRGLGLITLGMWLGAICA
jgi:hypothetical protein